MPTISEDAVSRGECMQDEPMSLTTDSQLYDRRRIDGFPRCNNGQQFNQPGDSGRDALRLLFSLFSGVTSAFTGCCRTSSETSVLEAIAIISAPS